VGFEGEGGVCIFYFFGGGWEVMRINMDIDGLNEKSGESGVFIGISTKRVSDCGIEYLCSV